VEGVTDRALDGLYLMIGEEEKAITAIRLRMAARLSARFSAV
jgi:hypothetical protein